MISATSNAFSITINAALPSDLWSSDNVPGTFNSATNQWTPGKGSDGRVTAVSYNLLPTDMRFVEIMNTRFDSLDSVVKTALPGFDDRGNGDWGGIFAYAGFTLDRTPTNPRIFYFGGGHHDSSNNGLYRFDFNRMNWNVQILPTLLTGSDSRYTVTGTGTFTSYPPAGDYELANPNQNLIFRDELYPFTGSAKVPTARHTYNSTAYSPERNEFYMGVQRQWVANLNTNTWSVRTPFGVNVNQLVIDGYGGPYMAGENTCGWWDEVAGVYGISAGQNSGKCWNYNPVTGNFAEYPYAFGGGNWWQLGSTRHERFIYGWCRPDSVTTAKLYRLNLDGFVQQSFNLTGHVAQNLYENFRDVSGLCYVPSVNKLLAITPCRLVAGGPEAVRLLWIDPVALTVSVATDITGNYINPATYGGDNDGKIQYVPGLHAIIWMQGADKNLRIMRLP